MTGSGDAFDPDAHVAWRLGRFAETPPRWPERLACGARTPEGSLPFSAWISALDLRGRPGFMPLNGFDARVAWDGGAFVAERGPMTNRPVWFGNALHRLGGRAPMLLNHCDAQGWDYSAIWPDLRDVPVFQYCRLPRQRDQVALVALDDAYAGPNSDAVPRAGYDPLPFRAKAPRLVWRGRASGTRQLGDRIDWAEGYLRRILTDPEADPTEALVALARFPRIRAVQALDGQDWANAGLALTPQERKLLARRPLPPQVRALIRAPLTREQQLQSRYILCIDGNDVPSGIYWALQSNSLVFRMSEGWETLLDFGLRPWEHFVPIAPDGSDLHTAFQRCESDPAMCQEIIANAHRALAWAVDPELRDRIDRAVLDRYGTLLRIDPD